MMSMQGRRPWDLESVSSQTSDVTSRATTIPDSPSETSIPTRERIERSNRIQSSTPTTTSASVNTVISKNSSAQGINRNQQQQPWVNPYWGSSATSGGNVIKRDSSSPIRLHQLIPGSIIVNDQGEIDHLSRRRYTNQSTGSTSSSLVPTHIQRHIVTTPPGLRGQSESPFGPQRSSSSSNAVNGARPAFNRQPSYPQTNDNNIQPWVNPYWPSPQSKPTGNQNAANNSSKNATTSSASDGTWKNPYWKDSKPQDSTATGQQQDKPWVNPYWKDSKPQNSTPTGEQQDKPWVNPYWKDSNPQDSTTTGQQQEKPWVNPYWKDSKPQNSTPTGQQQDKPWVNPDWKDSKSQTSAISGQQQEKPWVNPYWKDSKPQDSTTTGQQQNKPWVNPYWKDSKSQTSATSDQQQDKPWVNPYWKDKNTSDQKGNDSVDNGSLSFEYKVPPVPPFYERIYPLHTPSSSPVPTMDVINSKMISSTGLGQDVVDDEQPPFIIDNEGTAHYRAASSSAAASSKPLTSLSSATSSQYPQAPPNPSNTTVPSSQISFTASIPKSADIVSPPPRPPANIPAPPVPVSNNTNSTLVSNSANLLNYPSQIFTDGNVLTEDDVQVIQRAIQSFATNSNSISVVDAPNENVSFNTTCPNTFSSSSFAHNPGQQSYSSDAMPLSDGIHSGNKSSPLAALISGNPLQQSNQQSSTAAYPANNSSSLGALFSTNPVQPPNRQQSTTNRPENRTSPLSILFTRQQGPPPKQQYSITSPNVVYTDNPSSTLSTFFTRDPMPHINQPQGFSSSSARTSRPYSYDSHSQLLSVYCTSGSPPQTSDPLGNWITQQPVVFI